jgi:serine/threonine-protein kinase
MAPELFRTRPASKASDVYAVGVSFYYLLTGEFPYVERHVAKLAEKHASAPVPDPRERCPGLPDEAADLTIRCLAKRADERPADGEHVHRELQAISRGVCSLNKLVDSALRDMIVTRQDEEHRVTVCVPQPHGRSQRVCIEECRAPIARERVVRIYSVCGRADPAYYRRALELNARLCHGALAIQDIDGEPRFVMSNSFPRTTCDPEEIRRSIQEIARWADQVEAALATTDQY